MKPRIENIYDALKQAVMYYGMPESGWKCHQPQTFAVMDSKSVLNTENLGKTPCDRLKPFFFSRLWHNKKYNPSELSFEWPLVAVFEMSADIEDLNTPKQSNCYSIQLMVLDQYKDDCTKGSCQGCVGRVKNEIFTDTETMLYNILTYMKYLEWVKIGDEWRLIHSDLLDYYETIPGFIYTKDASGIGYKVSDMFRRKNAATQSFRIEGTSSSNLWGTAIYLKLCVPYCSDYEFDFSNIDKGLIPDVGCC